MAQQKTDAEQQKQDELKSQYDKEQELYNNKALLAKGENKEKLSLNFMYEPPAGMKKEREREDGEPEYKFEWQRKYNAPREGYCKDDDTIRDQPFGIQVRNVRCIKCKKWGHINTDKECELYTAPWELVNPTTSTDPLELMQGMRDNGLALKAGVVEGTERIPVHQLVASDDGASEEETEEMKFIKSLSQKDKLKLLKKLSKLQKKKKKQKKKKYQSKRASSDSDSSSDDSKTDDKPSQKKDSNRHSEREHSRKRSGERQRRHSSSDSERGHMPRRKESENRKNKRDQDEKYTEKYIKQEDEKIDKRGRQRSPEIDRDSNNAKGEGRNARQGERKRGCKRSGSRSSSPDKNRSLHRKRDKADSRNKGKVYSNDKTSSKKIKRENDDGPSHREKWSETGKKHPEKRMRHSSSRSRSPKGNRRDSRR